MDHVVYVDARAKELEKLLDASKSMLIRGATGRKIPFNRVFTDDQLYFIKNNAEGLVRARATVIQVINSEKMDQATSQALVEKYRAQLNLTSQQFKRWAGKRYLVLITIDNIRSISPFKIDRSNFGNMDDWLLVENIDTVKIA